MAVLVNYKCSKCGYSVNADKHGHHALMMGEFFLLFGLNTNILYSASDKIM